MHLILCWFFKMYLQPINYVPLYQPPIKNCNQKTIQTFSVVYGGGTAFHPNIKASPGYYLNQGWTTDHRQVVLLPVYIVQQHPRDTPTNMLTSTHINMMSVEQTANWIRNFGVHRGWQEAGVYACTFSKNKIKGSTLKHLNHEILKFDIGMLNHFHRLNLLATIRQLFPSCNSHTVIREPTRLSDLLKRDIKYDHCQRLVDPLTEKFSTLPYLLPDKDDSGMDISSVQNSNKSASIYSSDMECSESKCPRIRRIQESFYERNLQTENKILLSARKHMSRCEGREWGEHMVVYVTIHWRSLEV